MDKKKGQQQSQPNQYDLEYEQSCDIQTMESYWKALVPLVDWSKQPTCILDKSRPPFYTWFSDGQLNMCYNCVDRHLAKLKDSIAIHWESPQIKKSRSYTYSELYQNVSKLAWVFKKMGVEKGDRVLIYLPNIPEAIFSMLAASRIGAIHVVVYGGYAAKELAVRIQDAQPKLIVSASCGIDKGCQIIYYKGIVDAALEISKLQNKEAQILIIQREQHMTSTFQIGRDFDYYTAMKIADQQDCVNVESTHPLYILYTSGTTGQPKGIVRDTGGTAVGLLQMMNKIIGMKEKETIFCTADIGWVLGHVLLVYGPLLVGGQTILLEGKATESPDAGIYWRIIDKYQVNYFTTTPTSIRTIRNEDPHGQFFKKINFKSLKWVFLCGERCDLGTNNWIQQQLGQQVQINDCYLQTEVGRIISSNYANLFTFPQRVGTVGKPCPGYKIMILDNNNQEIKEPNKLGKICIKLPCPPSFMLTLYKNNDIFMQKYLSDSPGFYTSGDAGYYDEEGYLNIMSRIDDIINTGGKRISTAAIEQALFNDNSIIDAAVVSQEDDVFGEVPVAFIVVEKGKEVKNQQTLKNELIQLVKIEIGEFTNFKNIIIIQKLPKTKSGETLRSLLKKIVNNTGKETIKVPSTIEDESIISNIQMQVKMQMFQQKMTKLEFSPITKRLNEEEDVEEISSPNFKRRYSNSKFKIKQMNIDNDQQQ